MTNRSPIRLVTDDEITVFVQRPSFVDEDAITKVSLQRVRTATPPLASNTGDELTRIIDLPMRGEATLVTARAPTSSHGPRSTRGGRASLRVPIAIVALAAAGMMGVLWKRAHFGARRDVAVVAPVDARSTATNGAATTASAPSSAPFAAGAVPTPPGTPEPAPDERAAVEALASGSFAEAARLYRALSESHPTNDAYRVAARILLDRTKEASR